MRTIHQAYDPATGPAQAFPAGTGQGGRSFAAAGQPRRLRILGTACSAAAVAGWLVLGTGPAAAAPPMALAAAVADAAVCAPGGFTLNAQPGDSQVTLSWCQPSPDPDNPWTLASYSVADGTSPGGESALTSVDSATTSYTVQGLTNGTTYYFRVEAVPETEPVTSSPSTSTPSSTPIARTLLIPSGIWTNEVSATPEAISSVPGAPSGLRASPGDSQVTLSWTAPEAAGSSPVTGYDIYLGRSQGGESESPIRQVTGTSADITGLSNGIRYYFVVRADSAAGKSDPSNEVLAVPVAAGSGGTNHGGPGSGGHHQAGHPAQPGRLGWWTLAAGGGGILVIVVVILMIRRTWVRTRGPVQEPTFRVQPKAGPPGQVALHRTGSQPTITVRIDPDAGAHSVLVEEARP